jgi:hypothetical protein
LLSEKSELGSVPERQDEQGVATERSSSTRGHGQDGDGRGRGWRGAGAGRARARPRCGCRSGRGYQGY